MKKKYNDKRHILIAVWAIGLILGPMIVIMLLMSSSNNTTRFFGVLFADIFFTLVMLGFGIFQFLPRILKGRKVWKSVLMCILGLLWIFLSVVMIVGILPNYFKDIPCAVNANYTSTEGVLTDFHVAHRRTTRTYLTIEEKEFDLNGEYNSGFLIKGRRYRVEYLPNSKFVMNVYRYSR